MDRGEDGESHPTNQNFKYIMLHGEMKHQFKELKNLKYLA